MAWPRLHDGRSHEGNAAPETTERNRLVLAAALIDAACINQKEGTRRRSQNTRLGGRSAGVLLMRSIMRVPSELRVEVLGDEIIVILPATSYGVSYFKPGRLASRQPNLLA